MKKLINLFLIFSSIFLFAGCSQTQETPQTINNNPSSVDIFAMDTYMNLKAYGENADKVLNLAQDEITDLESLLSVTDPNSDIYKINSGDYSSYSPNEQTYDLILKSLEYCCQTDGALDISIYPVLKEWGFTNSKYKVPEQQELDKLLKTVDYTQIKAENGCITVPQGFEIDLGAVAKGYTSDRVISLMKENGIESGIVNLGGNVQTLGTKPDGSLWNVAVRNPFDDSGLCALQIKDKAVITSGNYERYFIGDDGKKYCHIINSEDGRPVDNGIISVTVIGENAVQCDAFSTALFVMGRDKAINFWKEQGGFDMIILTNDKKIYYTSTLKDSITNTSSFDFVEITKK